MTTTGRRGRLFRRTEPDLDDRDADLSEDQHAWWAARDGVAGVPRGTAPDPDEAEDTDTQFSDYWTAESLFEEQYRPSSGDPAASAEGDGDGDLPGAMDLDSAHLVLQIEVGADWDTVTKAHRGLAKQYHPDRLMAYSPEAQELGRARMAEINAAHATLRALHHY